MLPVLQVSSVDEAVAQLVDGVLAALPKVLAGLLFLVVVGVLIRVALWVLSMLLGRTLHGKTPVYRQFVVTVVSAFLWFGAILSFLSIVGLTAIAASLGTATGFVALGVAYALSGMIADVVAGVYLLRDPDFNPGDTVTVEDTTGVVRSIELRKTRFAVDGDTVVRANAAIEEEWRKVEDAG
jgi:small-conductance mechanosensitive channel